MALACKEEEGEKRGRAGEGQATPVMDCALHKGWMKADSDRGTPYGGLFLAV